MQGFSELRLTLPHQNIAIKPEETARLIRQANTRQADGPDVGSRPDLIIAQLHNYNRMQLTGDERYQLCVSIIQQIIKESDALRTQLSGRELLELHIETSFASKLLLKDCPAHSLEEKAQFAHWVLLGIVEQIRDHYEKYNTEPRNLWGELHRTYEFIVLHRLHDFVTRPSQITPEDTYKAIILLAAAEPNHLNQTEARIIHSWLIKWAGKSNLSPLVSRNTNQSYFYVNMHENLGVLTHRQIDEGAPNENHVQALNPLPLVHLAKEHMLFLKKGGDCRTIGINVDADNVDCLVSLKKCTTAWANKASRRDSRENCHQQVKLVIGMNQVVSYLKKMTATNINTVDGVALNQSRSGSCIEILDTAGPRTQVGDIVYEQSQGQVRHVAVIRWLKRAKDTLIFGIEFLAGKASPVAIKIKDRLTDALLISSAQYDTVLTGKGLYRGGIALDLQTPQMKQTLAAVTGALINRYGQTDQFKIIRKA